MLNPTQLARERYYTTNPGFESNVTTGGSGFGLMTIIAELIEVLFQEQKLFPTDNGNEFS
jgi:hypothetical protein